MALSGTSPYVVCVHIGLSPFSYTHAAMPFVLPPKRPTECTPANPYFVTGAFCTPSP